jgi:hypothetical protein
MEIADYSELLRWKILSVNGRELTTNPFREVFPLRHSPRQWAVGSGQYRPVFSTLYSLSSTLSAQPRGQ